MCGGLGTRFLPISKSIPKEMLPAINKPIIQYVVEEIAEAGIKDILIVVGRGKESIIDHFDKNIEVEEQMKKTRNGAALAELNKLTNMANIHFIRQIEPRGTGHAVLCAKTFVGENPFLLHYGDELFVANPSRTQQLIESFYKTGTSVIAVKEVKRAEVNRYGIVKPIYQDVIKIEEIVEKPEIEQAPSNLAYIGSAILEPQIFEYIHTECGREEQGIIDAFNMMAKEKALYAADIKGIRFDIGTPKGLIEVNNFLAKNTFPPIL